MELRAEGIKFKLQLSQKIEEFVSVKSDVQQQQQQQQQIGPILHNYAKKTKLKTSAEADAFVDAASLEQNSLEDPDWSA